MCLIFQVAKDLQAFMHKDNGTSSPRPAATKYADARALPSVVTTEYNIEGNPIPEFVALVLSIRPTQVTLVPDAEDAITSNAGWDTITHVNFLSEVINEFKAAGIHFNIC